MNAKKTLVAASLSAALLAAGVAQAGTLSIANETGKTTNFASDIFGVGSNVQEVYAADLVYVVGAGGVPAGKEIRFNLLAGGADGSTALLNTNLTDSHIIVLRNNAGAPRLVANGETGGDIKLKLIAGGQKDQFFATYKLTGATGLSAGDVVVLRLSGAVNVQGVSAALDAVTALDLGGGAATAVSATPLAQTKIKNVNKLGTPKSIVQASVSIEGGIDSTPAATIATSEWALKLVTNFVDPGTSPNHTINTATGDIQFSGVGSPTDFLTSRTFNTTGDFMWDVRTAAGDVLNNTVLTACSAPAGTWACAPALPAETAHIADPAGNLYAPDGADSVTVKISTSVTDGLAMFTGTGGKLITTSTACSATATTANALLSSDKGSATFNVTGKNGLGPYNVCLVTNKSAAMLPQDLMATLKYDNAEPTYQDPELSDYVGSLARNGCVVDIPNVPASDNAQEATFLRLFNKSAAVTGPVRVTVYAQDGSVIGEEAKLIKSTLAPHATAVWTVKELETALGVSPWTGRARVTFLNGFDACDGMGLLRTITSGELKNFSSSAVQLHNGQ